MIFSCFLFYLPEQKRSREAKSDSSTSVRFSLDSLTASRCEASNTPPSGPQSLLSQMSRCTLYPEKNNLKVPVISRRVSKGVELSNQKLVV